MASRLALAGGLAGLAVDVVYLAAIAQQGVTPPGGRVIFVAGWIAAAGALAILGAFLHRPMRRAGMLRLAAAMLIALGVPGIWSIGIPLLLCAVLPGIAAMLAAEPARMPIWAGLLGPLVLLPVAGLGVALGFALTYFP